MSPIEGILAEENKVKLRSSVDTHSLAHHPEAYYWDTLGKKGQYHAKGETEWKMKPIHLHVHMYPVHLL